VADCVNSTLDVVSLTDDLEFPVMTTGGKHLISGKHGYNMGMVASAVSAKSDDGEFPKSKLGLLHSFAEPCIL